MNNLRKNKLKHIAMECQKYELFRQRIKIDGTLDSPLGPETEENYKIIDFLKTSELYNSI